METLEYQIKINAQPEEIWTVLWSDISYQQWTSAFTKGSFYEGTLEEGTTVKFLDPNNNGMYSMLILKLMIILFSVWIILTIMSSILTKVFL